MGKQQETEQDQAPSTIRISCYSPGARKIMLTGSFNDWDPAALPMTKSDDGQWNIDFKLPAGRYEYRFVVDGVSCCEPHLKNGHPDSEKNALHAYRDLNRILLVR